MNNNNMKKPRSTRNNKLMEEVVEYNNYLEDVIAEQKRMIQQLEKEKSKFKEKIQHQEEEIEVLGKEVGRAQIEAALSNAELKREIDAYIELCRKLEQLVFKHD